MEIVLIREYFPTGTNGVFYYEGIKICESIELPWKNNQKQVSCIPEGRYRLVTKVWPGHGKRIAVSMVTNREGILIHCANDALNELKGCIAPVTKTTSAGKGQYSRIALERIEDLIIPVIDAREEVWLVITSPQSHGKGAGPEIIT